MRGLVCVFRRVLAHPPPLCTLNPITADSYTFLVPCSSDNDYSTASFRVRFKKGSRCSIETFSNKEIDPSSSPFYVDSTTTGMYSVSWASDLCLASMNQCKILFWKTILRLIYLNGRGIVNDTSKIKKIFTN